MSSLLAPFTGFGATTNTSVKFGILLPGGANDTLPQWSGGPRLNQFTIRHSSRVVTQTDGRDPYTVTWRLWFDDVESLEALDALQGTRATLWYTERLTKRIGGEVVNLAGHDYLQLTDVLLVRIDPRSEVRHVDGSCEATVTFQRAYHEPAAPSFGPYPDPPYPAINPSDYQVRTAPVATTWETYEASGVVVHPSVRYFPNGFNGSTWWAAMTPYNGSDSELENPSIVVSTDGTTWTEPVGVTNPLVPSPPGSAFNSDPYLTRDTNSDLLIFYREFTGADVGSEEKIRLLRSTNGITWTGPTTVLTTDASVSQLLSPAVFHDTTTDTWIMIGVEIQSSPDAIWRYTASAPEGPWTFDQVVSVTPAWPAGRAPWHLDAQIVGNEVVALIQTGGASGGPQYLAVSTDGGASFTRGDHPVAVQPNGLGYKSAILPRTEDGALLFDVWLGEQDADWGARRSTMTLPPESPTFREQQAAAGEAPYLAGDDFNRADSTSGLGTSSSGDTWIDRGGTHHITDGEAHADGTNAKSTIDIGISDYECGLTLTRSGSGEAYLMVRFVDGSNYVRIGATPGGFFFVQRVTGGGVTTLYNGGTLLDGSHRIMARCDGDTITVWLDEAFAVELTETQGETDTEIGIQSLDTSTTADNVWARPVGSVVT